MKRRPHWTSEEHDRVESFLGCPYVELGRTRGGLDCVGLVLLWFAEHGIETIPDPMATDPEDVRNVLSAHFRPVESPGFCDVVAMPGDHDPKEGHLGIWTPAGVLHSRRRIGVILEPTRRIKRPQYFRWVGFHD